MKSWWLRVPVILVCLTLIASVFLFGTVSYAASGTPEFGQVLNAMLDGWKELLKAFKDIILAVFNA